MDDTILHKFYISNRKKSFNYILSNYIKDLITKDFCVVMSACLLRIVNSIEQPDYSSKKILAEWKVRIQYLIDEALDPLLDENNREGVFKGLGIQTEKEFEEKIRQKYYKEVNELIEFVNIIVYSTPQ